MPCYPHPCPSLCTQTPLTSNPPPSFGARPIHPCSTPPIRTRPHLPMPNSASVRACPHMYWCLPHLSIHSPQLFITPHVRGPISAADRALGYGRPSREGRQPKQPPLPPPSHGSAHQPHAAPGPFPACPPWGPISPHRQPPQRHHHT